MVTDIPIVQGKINFAPSTLYEEIMQNVITICTTMKGTVPLDRIFGVSPSVIDEPVNTARAKISAQYIDAIRRFEPRCDVVRVEFRQGSNGEIIPAVSVKVKG